MRKILSFVILLVLFIPLVGCTIEIPGLNFEDSSTPTEEVTNGAENNQNGNENNNNENNNNENNNNQNDNLLGKDYFDEQNTASLYEDLFDINNKIVVKLNISETEIKKIQQDYEKYGSNCNLYRIAEKIDITITYSNNTSVTKSIEEVGIRMKGNTTRHSFYDNGIYSFIHLKLDFQETFDSNDYSNSERKTWNDDVARENRKNRTFFSLRGLELKYNAEGDLTYSRDIYSSMVYRENGIYAQATTVGIIDMNIDNKTSKSGTLGVYKIYEPVDRVFIKRYFPKENNDGELYKAAWGSAKGMPNLNSSSSRSYGIDEAPLGQDKTISYDLKTNKTTSTHENIKNFLSWINSSNRDLTSTLSNYIDEEYYITWLAIMYLSGDWDNFMYDSNNYYMYFDETGICYFIPYDMDRTYGLQAKNHGMGDKTPLDTWNLQGDGNRSNLLKKTIDANSSTFQNKYLNKIKTLSTSVLNYDKFMEVFNKVYNNYKDDVVPTITTLKYNYDMKSSNPFFHLIFDGEKIRENDSTDFNHAVLSYFNRKQKVVDDNC